MNKKLLVSITGRNRKDWQNKIKEINKYRIKEVALFLEIFDKKNQVGLFEALKSSCIKKIPLVHIRQDTTHKQINYLYKNFDSRYFTIHENHFRKNIIKHDRGYYKNLYLEMNTDDFVAQYVDVEKIGGFCVDLAHYKKQVTLQNEDYKYIIEHINKAKNGCNHLSGYSYKNNMDLHTVNQPKQFDYIKTLPHNIFGKVIAFEVFNPIKDQLKYFKHTKKILTKKIKLKIINNY